MRGIRRHLFRRAGGVRQGQFAAPTSQRPFQRRAQPGAPPTVACGIEDHQRRLGRASDRIGQCGCVGRAHEHFSRLCRTDYGH